MQKPDLPVLSKTKSILVETFPEESFRGKTLLTPAKSVANISRKRAQTTKGFRTKQSSSEKRFQDYKRNIVPNTDKSTPYQRKPYFIYEKGANLTPLALYDPNFPSQSEKLFGGLPYKIAQLSRFGAKTGETRSNSSMQSLVSASPSRFSLVRRSSLAPSLFSIGMASLSGLSVASLAVLSEFEEELEISPDDRAPSMFRLREVLSPREREIKTTFKVTLQESETMRMLEIPSEAEFLHSEEGKAIAVANYDYEKTKQTSKSLSHTATQTTQVIQKHRKLHMPKGRRANSSAWATVWDIYDTYNGDMRPSITSEVSREEGQIETKKSITEEETYGGKFEWEDQQFDHSFLDALMIMERLLQREFYYTKQLLYQGLLVSNPMSLDVQYKYSLKHLWTFKNKSTASRVVTSISNNIGNPNIIAVGYGKFKYTDKCNGLVCIWNVKSPEIPERHYEFEDPVTFVTFSSFRPQILAVTFYSGLVIMLDIISRAPLIKASNDHYPTYHPVWQCLWFPNEEKSHYQNLLTCNTEGRIYRYKKTKFFFSKKTMTMSRPHGNIQGVEQPKQCHARSILAKRSPSAEVIVAHPVDPLIYLVGTAEGCVYICSINHRKHHVEVFVAHNGPIYNIQYNPFCNKIFLTCGADWCIRIWAEGIFEPLITLESGMASVQGALWNPLHSTIILSITGTFIEVWDITRKISTPKSSMKSPTESLNTAVLFSQNKFNVYIGDVHGNVHVIALTEMPFSPAFQVNGSTDPYFGLLTDLKTVFELPLLEFAYLYYGICAMRITHC